MLRYKLPVLHDDYVPLGATNDDTNSQYQHGDCKVSFRVLRWEVMV